MDNSRWSLGSLSGWCNEGKWGESGPLPSNQTTRGIDSGTRAGMHPLFNLNSLISMAKWGMVVQDVTQR